MKSVPDRLIIISGLIGALLLCHVLGGLCTMASAHAGSAASVHAPSVMAATMAGEQTCGDTITSSSERPPARNLLASLPPLGPSPAACEGRGLSPSEEQAGAVAPGLPLYTRLSTFLI